MALHYFMIFLQFDVIQATAPCREHLSGFSQVMSKTVEGMETGNTFL